MATKKEVITSLLISARGINEKIRAINLLEQFRCYKFIFTNRRWIIGRVQEYGLHSMTIMLIVYGKEHLQHLQTSIVTLLFPEIIYKNIDYVEEIIISDLPLYINENTTKFYNQIIARDPLFKRKLKVPGPPSIPTERKLDEKKYIFRFE